MSAVMIPEPHPDAGMTWHYGNPFAEQRNAETSGIVVVRAHRRVLRLSGEDHQQWLHQLCTQAVANLPDGASTENLILDHRGHIQHHWIQTHLDKKSYLDTEPAYAEALYTYLHQMRFWAKVQIEFVDLAVLSLIGPHLFSPSILTLLGIKEPIPLEHAHALNKRGTVCRRVPGSSTTPYEVDLLVESTDVNYWFDRLVNAGLHPGGIWAYEAYRVSRLRSRIGIDTDERSIPHEHRWIGEPGYGAVHLHKGCYRGQETVARVHNLGRPPRMLVLLLLDGYSDYPHTGDTIYVDDHPVGRVGTVIDHYQLGPIALGLVKRSLPVNTLLTIRGDHQNSYAHIDPDSMPPADRPGAGRLAIQRFLSQNLSENKYAGSSEEDDKNGH